MSDAEKVLVKCALGGRRHSGAEVRRLLTEALERHPLVEEAYLFGSVAAGRAHRHSDVDLIVVARSERPFLERYRDFGGLFDIESDLDLLIYTPAEIERLRRPPHQGFWKSVWEDAVRLT